MHLIYPLHQWPILHPPERLRKIEQMSENTKRAIKTLSSLIHIWLFVNHNKMHGKSKEITLPMPNVVCSARTSLRTLTASLRVAGRQLQSTTRAKPSTTCSTPNGGIRSRDREWPLLEPCSRKHSYTFVTKTNRETWTQSTLMNMTHGNNKQWI